MKKNIWLINYHAYPPGKSKWTRHFDLFKNISDKFSFVIYGASYIHDTGEQILEKKEKIRDEIYCEIKYKTIKTLSYKNMYKRYISYINFLFRVFKESKKENKPDIIIGSSPDLIMGLGAYLLSKRYKAKFIFEIRDVWPETLVQLNVISRRGIFYFLFRKLEKFLYKKADKIIITAPGIKEHILETLKIEQSNKIHYINNGVDLTKFYKNLEKYRGIEILPQNKFNITYTGAIGLANGLDILVDTAKKLADLEENEIFINIIGTGPELERLQNKYSRLTNIKFYGSFKKEEIPNILNQSDCLFFSLKDKELFKKFGVSPNKLFEYLASSKPIIFSCRAYNDIVKIANAGVSLIKLDVNSVYEAIIQLKGLKGEEREKLGKNGKKYVEENFEFNILSKKLEELLNSL